MRKTIVGGDAGGHGSSADVRVVTVREATPTRGLALVAARPSDLVGVHG